MEENLDKNNELNKEISDNNTRSNSGEIKGPKSEKVILYFFLVKSSIMFFFKIYLC